MQKQKEKKKNKLAAGRPVSWSPGRSAAVCTHGHFGCMPKQRIPGMNTTRIRVFSIIKQRIKDISVSNSLVSMNTDRILVLLHRGYLNL